MIEFLNQKYEKQIKENEVDLKTFLIKINSDTRSKEEASPIYNNCLDYGSKVGNFIDEMLRLERELDDTYFEKHTFEELLKLNHSYYQDITGDNYMQSYTNPDVAKNAFGESLGRILSSLNVEIRLCVGLAFEHRKDSMMRLTQLFIKVMNELLSQEFLVSSDGLCEKLILLLKEERIQDLEDKISMNIFRRFNPEFNVYSLNITSRDLSDRRYIFRYGMYVGYNEIELMNYFENCPEEQIKKMADTYTEAFQRGFERNNVDLSSKKTVNIAFHLGFEKVLIEAVANFSKMGLVPLVYYDLAGTARPRLMNTIPCKQMEYDHRFDDGITFEQSYSDQVLEVSRQVLDLNKDLIRSMAGPALIEVFGEVGFEPLSKESCIKYRDEVRELKNKHSNKYQQLFNEYLPRSSYSFTIIAYPVPEIGVDFKEIFNETIKVNTLDEYKYMDIQQKIIEALDQGESVSIKGRNGNKTELTIALNEFVDIKNQTNFNNCTADVNVPVGEVFTSPRLEGTNGKLHVKEVFLFNLKYIDLEINFKEGMMDTFTCKNFKTEKENVDFILENLTHPHKSLPLGEFAIGTNTTAYAMAKKFDIEKIIPILIGEKMGPHFAIGDTCYIWSEEVSVFNPDGREIVARDNSKSQQRKTNLDDAYTYCHTDITIPYSELGDIRVNTHSGEFIYIIREGRFVLEGTQELNNPLQDIEV